MSKLEEIPEGPYCYTIIGLMENGRLPIKTCPYWFDGHCSLLNMTSMLLEDQVKECGIKEER